MREQVRRQVRKEGARRGVEAHQVLDDEVLVSHVPLPLHLQASVLLEHPPQALGAEIES